MQVGYFQSSPQADKSRVKVFRICSVRAWKMSWVWFRERSKDKQVSGTGWDLRGEGGNRGSIPEGRVIGLHLRIPEPRVSKGHFPG